MVRPGFPPSPHTKEIFIPAASGTERAERDLHSGFRINAQTEYAIIEFRAPHDLANVVAVEVIVVSQYDVAWSYALASRYGAVGQNKATHFTDGTPTDVSLSANILAALNAAGVLSALAAADIVGLQIYQTGTTTVEVLVLGVRLRYT